jgi:hypothetical protein
MKSVGLASASIATYKDKTCLLELKIKKTYPVINYKIVEKPERLGDEIMSYTECIPCIYFYPIFDSNKLDTFSRYNYLVKRISPFP